MKDEQSNLANQLLGVGQPKQLSVEESWAKSVLDPLERADAMYPGGTYEHAQMLGAALISAWPQIRGLLKRYPR